MSTNSVPNFALASNDVETLMSWSDTVDYQQPQVPMSEPEHYLDRRLPVEQQDRPHSTRYVHESHDEASAKIHGAGLHPLLGSPFRPQTHHQVPVTKSANLGTPEDIGALVLHQVASGYNIETIAQTASQQYGFRVSVDDALLAYRSAYWKSKTWESRDTQAMEEAVQSETSRFWERIASEMRNNGCLEWPPNEIKMRFQQLHPDSTCLRL